MKILCNKFLSVVKELFKLTVGRGSWFLLTEYYKKEKYSKEKKKKWYEICKWLPESGLLG